MLCLASGYTESLFRYGQDNTGLSDFLMRSSEGSDSAELFLVSSPGQEWEIRRFILESSRFVAGNIKPSGLFAVTAMDSLFPDGEGPGKTLWLPDRGEQNMNNPGGAVFFPKRGGIFLEGTDSKALRSGIWYSLPLGRYLTLEGAGHSCRLDPEEPREEWFSQDELRPAGTLWHAAGDLSYEGPWFTGSFKGLVSGGEHYLPGSSLMYDLTFYGPRSELTGRFWHLSDFYRNREGDLIPWEKQYQARISRIFPCFHMSSSALVGESSEGKQKRDLKLFQDYRCTLEGRIRRWSWQIRGQSLSDPEDEISLYWIPRGKIGYHLKKWDFSAAAGGEWESYFNDPASVSGDFRIRWKASSLFRQSLKMEYTSTREQSNIVILGEARGVWKNWCVKGRFLYPYILYGEEDRSFEIGGDLEWSY